MAESMKRRWRWWIVGVVLLLVGSPIAWSFRPLNAVERRLVGQWRCPSSDARIWTTYTLTADRRAIFDTGFGLPLLSGSWSASDAGLLMSFNGPGPKSWAKLPRQLFYDIRRRLSALPSSLEFQTNDEVVVASTPNQSSHWRRVRPLLFQPRAARPRASAPPAP